MQAFWHEVAGKGPLVEEIAGNDRDVDVTFLWREIYDTRNVRLVGGPIWRLHVALARDGCLVQDRATAPGDAFDIRHLTERSTGDPVGDSTARSVEPAQVSRRSDLSIF